MHLLIATREDPQLPLARLRGRGQLTELRAADLRFTRSEAAAFLNQVMGLSFSAQDIAAVPVFAWELTLAIWLIAKGFNPSATASESAKTATNELVSVA